MKSYALPQTQETISIVTDDSGNYLIETLVPAGQFLWASEFAPWNQPDPVKPEDLPEDQEWAPDLVSHDPADYPGMLWTPPLIVELAKIPKPDQIPGKIAEPVLVWTDTGCTRDWVVRDMTPSELADSLRKVWPSSVQFLGEFTMPELGGISVSIDPTIAAMRLILSSWIGPIYSDDPRVVMGLAAIEAAGIISAERRAQIAPAPAPVISGALSADTATIGESGVLTFGGGITPVLAL